MPKKIRDTDYLAVSARIRAMETGLLTDAQMEQILTAQTDEEAVKLLRENGYPTMSLESPETMDAAICLPGKCPALSAYWTRAAAGREILPFEFEVTDTC